MNTVDLINEAASLPVEERARLADFLLQSLNHPESAIDEQWLDIARQRLVDVRSGKVQTIPAETVFENVRRRFEQ